MRERRVRVTLAVSLALGCLAFAPAASGQVLRPNLRALPPANLGVVNNVDTGNPELRLSATSWNSGAGPLELVPGAAAQAKQDVYQRVYNRTARSLTIWPGISSGTLNTIIFTSRNTPFTP